MEMIVVIGSCSVIRIALHQYKLWVNFKDGMYGALNFAYIRCTCGNEERFTFGRHAFQCLNPVNLSGAGFVHLNIGVKHINGFKVIWCREEINASLIAYFFKNRGPFEWYGSIRVDLKH